VKKLLAILAAVAVVGGGGATAAVLLSNNDAKFETTATVTLSADKTIYYAPHDTWGDHAEVRWGPELFAQPSSIYNHDLALVASALCASAHDGKEENGKYLIDAYKTLGFDKGVTDVKKSRITLYSYPDNDYSITKVGASKSDNKYYYDGSRISSGFFDNNFIDDNLAFSIASRDMGGFQLLVVTCRGTEFNDWATDVAGLSGFETFLGEVKLGLEEYLERFPGVVQASTKILVTGYSLGGAAANLFAAKFNASPSEAWSNWVAQDNVYCYTFASPLTYEGKVRDGYSNIFNVVNKMDWVPMDFPLNTSNGKRYGHDYPFTEGDKKGVALVNYTWHPIQLYVQAVNGLRDEDSIVPVLESAVAASWQAAEDARQSSVRAAEDASRQAVEESKRQEEERRRQEQEQVYKDKLEQLAIEANQGSALGSLFSFGTMQTQVCAFGSGGKYGLIYKTQYNYNVVDTESEARNLQNTVNLQSAIYQPMLDRMAREGIPNPTVIVQYINNNGSMIYEREFK